MKDNKGLSPQDNKIQYIFLKKEQNELGLMAGLFISSNFVSFALILVRHFLWLDSMKENI